MTAPSRSAGRREARRQRTRRRNSNLIVGSLVAASAAGGAFAGCHPTGTTIIDPLYTALLAGLVTLAGARASRACLLVLAAAAAALSRGWLLIPGFAALAVAFASVFSRRQRQRIGALVGALSIQVVLRWPSIGFQGLTALIVGAAVVICLISALTHLSRRWRRRMLWTAGGFAMAVLVLAVPVVFGALDARPAIDGGIASTEHALTSVTQGGTDAGIARLDAATVDFTVASHRTDTWWTAGGRLVPVVAQQRQAVADATSTARTVTAAADRDASTMNLSGLKLTSGHLDLNRVRNLAAPVANLRKELATAQAKLAAIRSPWLVSPIQSKMTSLDAQLNKAKSSLNLASQAIQVAPAILGGDGVRHYFIAFMTPSESRGLDGFIGTYGEMTIDNGQITLTRSGDVAELNKVPKGTRHITGPASYLARYGAFEPQDNFQDLTYSPDFPTDADVISQMYPQSGGDHIDGVLALDPYGLAALLKLTGPITVPGLTTPLTYANAALFLLKSQYSQFGAGETSELARHNFLDEALGAAFGRLVGGSLPDPEALAQQLGPEVQQGRILFWSDHPDEQPLLRRLGLAGAFPRTPGKDLLAVTTQNAANNKIDAYLDRTVNDKVTFNPATGETQSAVTITLHNTAPATGLPSDVLGSYRGSGLPPGTNRTWLSVYSPLNLTHSTQDGATMPVDPVPELGVNTYSAYVNIPAGATVTITLQLSGSLQAGHTYTLTLWRQPGVTNTVMTTHVTPTPGWVQAPPSVSDFTAPARANSATTSHFSPTRDTK